MVSSPDGSLPTSAAAQLASADKLHTSGKLTDGQYEVIKAQLQPTEQPAVQGNPVLTRQLASLALAHQAGTLSDEKYEQMRADILRYTS